MKVPPTQRYSFENLNAIFLFQTTGNTTFIVYSQCLLKLWLKWENEVNKYLETIKYFSHWHEFKFQTIILLHNSMGWVESDTRNNIKVLLSENNLEKLLKLL